MNTLTVLCNVVFVLFTCLVLADDGFPTAPAYIVFTLLMLLVPAFTVLAIARSGAATGTAMKRVAGVANIVLLACIGLAIVDQYPHPAEPGFVPYVVLALLTPILSLAVLFRRGGTGTAPASKGGSERGVRV